MKLIELTNKGFYCRAAKVYIDPWKKVDQALITHGHSDHARYGHTHYLCANSSVNILKHRLGPNLSITGIEYGEKININGVSFSFHPAGHITGSSQIRVEHRGEVWCVTGDYKTEDDGLAEAFELVRCHTMITECTFGLPIYRWEPQELVIGQINRWWASNATNNVPSIVTAYSLGKAQRIIHSINQSIGPIYTHDAVEKINEVYRTSGNAIPKTTRISPKTSRAELAKALIVTPSSGLDNAWLKRLGLYSLGTASGWMAIRGNRRRQSADRGFVLSDHCDWTGLNEVVRASGAETILTTHGNTETFSRWLSEQGYNASPVKTEFSNNIIDDQGG